MDKADIKALGGSLKTLKKGGFFVYYLDKDNKGDDSKGHTLVVSKKAAAVIKAYKDGKKKDTKATKGQIEFDKAEKGFNFILDEPGNQKRVKMGLRTLAASGAPLLKRVKFPGVEAPSSDEPENAEEAEQLDAAEAAIAANEQVIDNLIAGGNSLEDILANIDSRSDLTEDQKEELRAIADYKFYLETELTQEERDEYKFDAEDIKALSEFMSLDEDDAAELDTLKGSLSETMSRLGTSDTARVEEQTKQLKDTLQAALSAGLSSGSDRKLVDQYVQQMLDTALPPGTLEAGKKVDDADRLANMASQINMLLKLQQQQETLHSQVDDARATWSTLDAEQAAIVQEIESQLQTSTAAPSTSEDTVLEDARSRLDPDGLKAAYENYARLDNTWRKNDALITSLVSSIGG